jgi:dTDP-4-dehydrorhamnose 3,5-epimerase
MMTFTPTSLEGVVAITLDPREDDRGSFVRTFCELEFQKAGLNTRWPQANLSQSWKRGTIRGLHWQSEPRPEIKLVRCSRGAIFDVVVDVRPHSASWGHWAAFELSARQNLQLYIPAGFAHGFQALEDHCEVSYLMSEVYHPELARGLRWDDAEIRVPWPIPNPTLSDRDRQLPLLSDLARLIHLQGQVPP